MTRPDVPHARQTERALNRAARRMRFRLYLTLARLNFILFKIKTSRVHVRAHSFLLRHLPEILTHPFVGAELREKIENPIKFQWGSGGAEQPPGPRDRGGHPPFALSHISHIETTHITVINTGPLVSIWSTD